MNYARINEVNGLKFCIDKRWDILKIKPLQWIFKKIPWYLFDTEKIDMKEVGRQFGVNLHNKIISLSLFDVHICNIYFYNVPTHYTISKQNITHVICRIINRKLNMQLIEFETFRNIKEFKFEKADPFMKEKLKEKYGKRT